MLAFRLRSCPNAASRSSQLSMHGLSADISSPLPPPLPGARCFTSPADDLEEGLLFDFEADEVSSLTPKHTVTSSLISAAASAGSLPGTAASLPSMISGVRSITKDSTGTHVLTENFTLHIEEVGGVGWDEGMRGGIAPWRGSGRRVVCDVQLRLESFPGAEGGGWVCEAVVLQAPLCP